VTIFPGQWFPTRDPQKNLRESTAFICAGWKQNSEMPNCVPWWSSLQKTNCAQL